MAGAQQLCWRWRRTHMHLFAFTFYFAVYAEDVCEPQSLWDSRVFCVLTGNMEPLPVWGPSSWTRDPTAHTFRLVRCVLFLSSLWRVPAQSLCREEEYPVGAECCPRCNPGYHVKQACSELTGTVCEPCPPQTYTAHANGLSQCLPCGICDPDMGMVTWRECSAREDTVCHCIQGYFCKTEDGDHCAMCLPHSTCSPGQRVQNRGTDSQDTMCADCLVGTFSPGGTQEECLPWTTCRAWIEEERGHGTSRTDVTCSYSSGFYILLVFMVLVLVLVPMAVLFKRRHTRPVAKALVSLQEKRQNTVRFPVTEVTIVAEEETALNH